MKARILSAILHALPLHAAADIDRPGTDGAHRLAPRCRGSGRRPGLWAARGPPGRRPPSPNAVPCRRGRRPTWGSSRQATAAPASIAASTLAAGGALPHVDGLDHLSIGQYAVVPGLAAAELDEVDAALVGDGVHRLEVHIGEDADGEGALPLQQPLQRLRRPPEPVGGARRLRPEWSGAVAASRRGLPRARTISPACAVDRRRGLSAKTRPMKSAPASAAARASSTRPTPQILTRVIPAAPAPCASRRGR